jgi:hypothetical protein
MSYLAVETPDGIQEGVEELIITLNVTSDLAGFTEVLQKPQHVQSIREVC